MRVLVTNDDGYKSIGLKKLVEKIVDKYDEIVVVAPKTQKSATSHSIILRGGIEFKQVEEIIPTVKTYYCDGNPADCVSFARCVLNYKYDLVISGCNNGVNLGYDIMYSGTVAGAADGLIDGKKGLSVSCAPNDFDSIESFEEVLTFIDVNKLFDKTDLINVNLVHNHKGIKITKAGKTVYGAYYDLGEDGLYYPRMGDVGSDCTNDVDTDWAVFLDGFTSVTPLTIDMTDLKAYNEYKK